MSPSEDVTGDNAAAGDKPLPYLVDARQRRTGRGALPHGPGDEGETATMLDPDQDVTIRWSEESSDINSVQHALGELLRQLNPPADEGEPHPPMRTSLLNRVVRICPGAESSRGMRAMEALFGLHPSRTLMVSVDRRSERSGLDASATVHCLLRSGSEPRVCLEEVQLAARGELADHLPSVVAPLLVPDMPVVLWWLGDLPGRADGLLATADRLILDSGLGGMDRLPEVRQLLDSWGGRMIVTDLAWSELTVWREMAAQLFDPTETRHYQPHIHRVRIEYAAGASTSQPLLFLGWLASRLGWQPTAPSGDGPAGSIGFARREGVVAAELVAVADGKGADPGDLVSLHLEASLPGKGRAGFSVIREEDCCVRISRELPAGQARSWVLPFSRPPWTELLSRELDVRSADTAFREAVSMAVKSTVAAIEEEPGALGEGHRVVVAADAEAQAMAAATLIVDVAADSIRERGVFTIALSGGSTPKALFELLASAPWRERVDWSRWQVFWGDDRLVAPDHPDSNYRLAWESLLSRVPVPPQQVHRIRAELGISQDVAAAYEAELRDFFGEPEGGFPSIDLALQGMGSDGHTASLFPGFPTLEERNRWVVSSPPGTLPPPVDRATMTLPVLNAASHVLFLVAGRDKAPLVKRVLAGDTALPAALVRPSSGSLHWILDAEAAGIPD